MTHTAFGAGCDTGLGGEGAGAAFAGEELEGVDALSVCEEVWWRK